MSRDVFETFIKNKYGTDLPLSGRGDGYHSTNTRNMYESWQASRQSLADEVTDDDIRPLLVMLGVDIQIEDYKTVRDWLRKIGGEQ